MARHKFHPNNAFVKSTRYALQQREKKLRPKVLKIRANIPWIFGENTYVYTAIAANGGVLRETDITATLGEAATRSLHQPDRDALGITHRFQIQNRQGRGPAGHAVMFDKAFPLAKQIFALARKIGEYHPLPVESNMAKELLPPPSRRKYDIDLVAGSEVNTLVLATTRVLRGSVTRSELAAAVPHDSYTAVERSVQRLLEYGILNATKDGIYFKDAPWKPQLERLFDAYLRLRPELRGKIRARAKTKRQHQEDRSAQGIFGYDATERVLTTLAVHGPMPRTELASLTLIAREEIMLNPLIKASILATEVQLGDKGKDTKAHGTRKRIAVSLNAAFPAYRELRALLLSLAGEGEKKVRDFSNPQDDYDAAALFQGKAKRRWSSQYQSALLKALLLMNSVEESELDVASLNRLRPEHAPFTLHGRMRWLLDQGIIRVRKQGLLLYYSLNPDYRAHKALKRLLNRIANVWPDLVAAAAFNDELKPARRLTQDRNARRLRDRRGVRLGP